MEAINVTTTITDAEVYRRGCTITLAGEVALAQGENRLLIEGLPDGLDDGSVSLRMPAGVRQGQVRVVLPDVRNDLAQIDDLRELEAEVDELDRQIENKKLELDAWKGIAANVSGSASLDYLDRLPAKLDDLTQALTQLRRRRLEASLRRDARRERLGRPRLRVDVTAGEAATLPLEVRCRSSRAGWKPAFDVLVEKVGEPLKMRLKGEVWQRTGDDWHDVTLRLSTGTSTVAHDLPRFATRYLRKFEPRPQVAYDAAPMMASGPMPRMSKAGSLASSDDAVSTTGFILEELSSPEATIEEQATVTTYELVGPQTLLGGGEEQTVTVSTREIEATYMLYAYPRREEAAYLVAHLEDEPSPESMEQPVAIYLEGSYAGTIRIGRTNDDGGYELPLGKDDRVRVRRTETTHRSKRRLSGRVVLEHASEIRVESRRQEAAQLVIVEQVPVSLDKEIEVELGNASGADFDEKTGELRWRGELAPGSSVEWGVSYTVSHPQGLRVDEGEGRGLSAPGGFGSPGDTSTFCVRCGSPLRSGTRFCPVCGCSLR